MGGEKTLFDLRSSQELFSRRRLVLSDRIQVGRLELTTKEILARLESILLPERIEKLKKVVSNRTLKLASVLENIHDRGNVSAVMRSADAFGFMRMHLIDPPGAKFKAAKTVSKGADKWLDIRLHSSPTDAVKELRKDGYRIFATHLETKNGIEDMDFSTPIAVVLGNEKGGVSQEMLGQVDGTFRIPMYGFSQSFNISVAAALIFYHARMKIGSGLTEEQARQVLANYYLRCFDSPETYFSI